ncbi:MAG: MFS transporter [Acidimicrobiales bacterium]
MTTTEPATTTARRMPVTLSSFAVPYYPRLWASGWLWNSTRWMSIFVGAYLVNQRTGSPLLVQLVGTIFYLPMFVGGLVAGSVSDRYDRRRTILRQLGVLAPLALLMSALLAFDAMPLGMIFVFMALVGVGGVVDMTSRRALVHDLVGDKHLTNALALEMGSMSLGNMLGTLSGGAVLDFIGPAQVFLLIAGCYGAGFVLLLSMPAPARRGAPAGGGSRLRADLREGVRFFRTSTAVRSVLGITVAVNFFMFAFNPLVPVFAERLGLSAFSTGLLASATGLGMGIGSFGVAAAHPRRRGRVYLVGSFLSIAALCGFAQSGLFPLSYALLVLTGIGGGMFGATQSALVLSVTDPELRGRAMGLLSMAIGSLPFGMFMLGVAAESLGPVTAVTASSLGGLAFMIAWLKRRPETIRIA